MNSNNDGKIDQLASLQISYMNNDLAKEGRDKLHESWFRDDTVDFWRHKRMYETMRPFAENHLQSEWTTVGDGRYALDSVRLKKIFGIKRIFPTDIASVMMEEAKKRGLIENYGIENAEKLSFADNSRDVIFCKEAFHHFPRPYLALYEMIRVAREAVVMIEPAERMIVSGALTKKYLVSALKLFISKISRKPYLPYLPGLQSVEHKHEEAGNYLYAVSVREMEKLVHGLDLADMAYFEFNDAYLKGVEFEKSENNNQLFCELKKKLDEADKICAQYPFYHAPNMVTVILFKKKPDSELRKRMLEYGYRFINKVPNPYL